MSVSAHSIKFLRKERGWSQSQLAIVSGLSERTIQRIENRGECTLDSKMALASAFEIAPQDLKDWIDLAEVPEESAIDWAQFSVAMLVLLFLPVVMYLLTSTHGVWEVSCLLIVDGLTFMLSSASYGFRRTLAFFSATVFLLEKEHCVRNYKGAIKQANLICQNAYVIGLVTSLVYLLTVVMNKTNWWASMDVVLVEAAFPLLYAILLAEFLTRPFKHKMEKQLSEVLSVTKNEAA